MWWKKRPRSLSKAPYFPSGTFIRTEKGDFYVQSATKRYRFITQRVLDSWSPKVVIETTEASPAVQILKIAYKMKFRNGSLICSQSSGKMYLVSESKLRHITNPDWLDNLGLNRDDAVWVSQEEIEIHTIGEPLS